MRTRKSHIERDAEKRAEEKKGGSRLVANALSIRVRGTIARVCVMDGAVIYDHPFASKVSEIKDRSSAEMSNSVFDKLYKKRSLVIGK